MRNVEVLYAFFIVIKSSTVTLATAESLGNLLKKPKCYLHLHICNQFRENNWGFVWWLFVFFKTNHTFFPYDYNPENFSFFFFLNKSVLVIELRQIMSHLHPE